jgi:O-methyltransferase
MPFKNVEGRPYLEGVAKRVFAHLILPFVDNPLSRQRIKLVWFVWGYWPLLFCPCQLSIVQRFGLLMKFMRVDWHILHGHTPNEMARIVIESVRLEVGPGAAMVEAGCWNGGSTAKFSALCECLGWELHVYDSFQGVEDVSRVAGEWDYSGQYSAAENTVRDNLKKYGADIEIRICPGWFADTLSRTPVPAEIAVAYIDCDIAKGTAEALSGILPSLMDKGVIFSQDYHITPVKLLLSSAETWVRLKHGRPEITQMSRRLSKLSWT